MVRVREVYLSYSAHVGTDGNLVVGYTLGSPYATNLLGAFALNLEDPYLVGVGDGQTFARVAVSVFLYQLAHQAYSLACCCATLQCHTCQLLYHKHPRLVLHRIPTAIGSFSYTQLMLVQTRVGSIQIAIGMFHLRNLSLLLHARAVAGMFGVHGSFIYAHDGISWIILLWHDIHPGTVPRVACMTGNHAAVCRRFLSHHNTGAGILVITLCTTAEDNR